MEERAERRPCCRKPRQRQRGDAADIRWWFTDSRVGCESISTDPITHKMLSFSSSALTLLATALLLGLTILGAQAKPVSEYDGVVERFRKKNEYHCVL